MGQPRSPLGEFFIDKADLSNEELRELISKTFPGTEITDRQFWGYRHRARQVLAKRGRKKPGPKRTAEDSVPVPEVPTLTADAKQLTALIMRVGLNTAEVVMARLKHIEEKQR